MTHSLARRGLLGMAAGLLATPAVLRAQTVPPVATLADTFAGDARFSQFLNLITRASVVEDFRQAQPMTVFAPIDSAFLGAASNIINELTGTSRSSGNETNNPERGRLGALIGYHVVPGTFRSGDLMAPGERRLRTRNGSDLTVTSNGTEVTLSNPAPGQQLGGFRAGGINASAQPAKIVQANIMASNGIIHAIDQVIWP